MNKIEIPNKEMALVLQGGGALGAYGAGAFKGLYECLNKKATTEDQKKSQIFDIVAGTSIGAINAAVIVSYVLENQTYEGAAERLLEFWKYLSKESIVEKNPFFKYWWNYFHSINPKLASGESARRYYSAKEFALYGVSNVFSPPQPTYDDNFYDIDNTWYRYSNEPLKKSLERFAKFPIATTQEENQPRLILVAVDVADGIPVTFDSYPKEDGTRKTEYGRFLNHKNKEIGFEHIIRYDKGITSDHVIASGSFPVNFDFSKIEVESYYSDPNNSSIDFNRTNSEKDNCYRKDIRYFWDGGLLSNTPLLQVVLLHRYYWYKIRGLNDSIPRLGICIVNLHPKKQAEIPTDRDGVINRNSDIIYSDRTQYEEAMLLLASDYIDLVRALIKLSRDNGVKSDVINNLLNQNTRYHGEFLKAKKFLDIIEGRFQIDEIININRKNDANTISNKTFDFSIGTIKQLLELGYVDAREAFEEYTESLKRSK